MIERALLARGFSSHISWVNGEKHLTFTSPTGKTWTSPTSLVHYPGTSDSFTEIADNKLSGLTFAQKNGFPIPPTYALNPGEQLTESMFNEIRCYSGKAIVKPCSGYGGSGVSIGITDYSEIAAAVERAWSVPQRYGQVLVQSQVSGDELRFVVLDGVVIAVVARQKIRLKGDGEHTIEQLVLAEDAVRTKINSTSMVQYPSVESIAANHSLLKSTHIPLLGEYISLSSSSMISGGASVYNVIKSTHDSYIKATESMAKQLDTRFLVADVFSEDYRVEMTPQNTYFNEFNRSPALKLFYSCRDGKNVDVLQKVVTLFDDID